MLFMFNATIGVIFFCSSVYIQLQSVTYIYTHIHTYIFFSTSREQPWLLLSSRQWLRLSAGRCGPRMAPARWWGSSVLQTIKLGICLGMVCYGLSCISHNMIGQWLKNNLIWNVCFLLSGVLFNGLWWSVGIVHNWMISEQRHVCSIGCV